MDITDVDDGMESEDVTVPGNGTEPEDGEVPEYSPPCAVTVIIFAAVFSFFIGFSFTN